MKGSEPGHPASAADESPIDGLLWIGQTYGSIDCGRQENCAKTGSTRCFVHEAEWRGISRKIAPRPKWTIPGQSRIFLVHRGQKRLPDEGEVFGYFVFHGCELLSSYSRPLIVPDSGRPRAPLAEPLGGILFRVYDLESGRSLQATVQLKGAKVQRAGRSFAWLDGLDPRSYRVHITAGEDYSAFETIVDVKPGWKSVRVVFLSERAREGTVEDTVNFHVEALAPGLASVPIENEPFSDHRSCSLRLIPGGIYLVDRLCSEITHGFAGSMNRSRVREVYHSATTDSERQHSIDRGREIYRGLVSRVREDRKPAAAVAPELEGGAQIKGDLVIFDQPVTLVRRPSASFRSLLRIDGQDLLHQVASGETRLTVRPYAEPGRGRDLTKAELVAALASASSSSLAASERFLDQMAHLGRQEIHRKGVFRVPGVGEVRGSRVRGSALTKRETAERLRESLDTRMSRLNRTTALQVSSEMIVALAGSTKETLERDGKVPVPGLGVLYRDNGEVRFRPMDAWGDEQPAPVSLAGAAPESVPPGGEFTARFVACLKPLEKAVETKIKELSSRSKIRFDFQTLQWEKGTEVEVSLDGRHLEIEDPRKSFVWNGRRNVVSFDVRVADEAPSGVLVLKFDVRVEGRQVAGLRIDLTIDQEAGSKKQTEVSGRPIETAFVSYAGEDKTEARRIRGLYKRVSVDAFVDHIDLLIGEPFPGRLEKEIIDRDAFILLWCQHAHDSEWVEWEWKTALRKKKLFVIDWIGPSPLPDELKHLHFGAEPDQHR